jgi:hypothetical protein
MSETPQQSHEPAQGRAAAAACLIVAASVVVGLVGGLVWAAVAPRVLYQVVTINPPTAYATNPETSAFIAADGWYCLLAVVGGALIGLLGYLVGVRRYGAVPMAGIVIGATGAAFLCEWLGHRQSGGPGFNHLLATSMPGTLLHAPISLGSHGALAFWPLAAAAVAGGIELVVVLRARHQASYAEGSTPGIDSFGTRNYPGGPDPGQPPHPDSSGRSVEPHSETRPGYTGGPCSPGPFGGDSGRAAL